VERQVEVAALSRDIIVSIGVSRVKGAIEMHRGKVAIAGWVLLVSFWLGKTVAFIEEDGFLIRDRAWQTYLRGLDAFQHSPRDALDHLTTSFTLYPTAPAARKLTWTYDMLGDRSASMYWLRNLLLLDNVTIMSWLEDGIRKHFAGDYVGAIVTYDTVLGVDPDHTDTMYHKGVAYQYLGDVQGAAEFYWQTVQLDPYHTRALLNLAALHQKYGSYDVALTYYLKGVDVFTMLKALQDPSDHAGTPPYLHPHDSMLQYNLGLAYMQLNRLDEVKGDCLIVGRCDIIYLSTVLMCPT
jgi:tetratricopeptide (TPR) repeat protein